MVEVVRGLRYRDSGDKIFGRPVRPLPERIGPAATGNSARRKITPRSHRREVLTNASRRHKIAVRKRRWHAFKRRLVSRRPPGLPIFEKHYRGKRKSMRVACSTPLSSTWPRTITNEPSLTSSICPGFPPLVHSVEPS